MAEILVIDNETPVVDFIDDKLSGVGHQVRRAAGGKEGERRFNEFRPDLVILSLSLPDVSGLRLYRRLKAHPGAAGLPVILSVVKTNEAQALAGLEEGAIDYLIKPFSPGDLIEKISPALKASDSSRRTLLLRHLKKKFEFSARMERIFAALEKFMPAQETPRRILEYALKETKAKTGSLMILDDQDRLKIVVAKGLSPEIIKQTRIKLGEGISGSVASIGEPLLVNDLKIDDRYRRLTRARYESRSLICVPLKVEGRTIGVLNVSDKSDGTVFNYEDLDILVFIGRLGAVLLKNIETEGANIIDLTERRLLKRKAL